MPLTVDFHENLVEVPLPVRIGPHPTGPLPALQAIPDAVEGGRIVDASTRLEGRNEFDFAIEVNRTPESADVYPIALVSYHIICLQYPDQETVNLVQAFMTYVGSEAGQAASGASAGSAPISAEVRVEILTSIDAISVAG